MLISLLLIAAILFLAFKKGFIKVDFNFGSMKNKKLVKGANDVLVKRGTVVSFIIAFIVLLAVVVIAVNVMPEITGIILLLVAFWLSPKFKEDGDKLLVWFEKKANMEE